VSDSDAYVFMRERKLPYETFDPDNHLYETEEALTKFLPKGYKDAVKYLEVDGRTKLALHGQISHYIPNQTFNRVAVPPGWGGTAENKGQAQAGSKTGIKPKAMPSPTPSSTPSLVWSSWPR